MGLSSHKTQILESALYCHFSLWASMANPIHVQRDKAIHKKKKKKKTLMCKYVSAVFSMQVCNALHAKSLSKSI